MPVYIDQTGRKVSIPLAPQRIISLVPSQTEFLFDLGLRNEVVGITKFCIHPSEWFTSKTKIGGTKQVQMDVIHALKPDLIIANKEENVKEQIEELEKHYPVWISDVNNLDDAYQMIEQIGIITGKQKTAIEMIADIQKKFALLPTPDSRIPTVYLIWQNPYMTVGGDTFIHSMLEEAGFNNIFANKKRYPEVKVTELRTMNLPAGRQGCELLFLSSEPFPFQQKHIDELQTQLPHTKIVLVDGEMFSWYGSRLLKAPAYFKSLQSAINKRP